MSDPPTIPEPNENPYKVPLAANESADPESTDYRPKILQRRRFPWMALMLLSAALALFLAGGVVVALVGVILLVAVALLGSALGLMRRWP